MPLRDIDEQKHKPADACTVVELGAYALSQKKSSRGTAAEANKDLNCAPLPKFDSLESVIAEQTKRQKAGSAPLNAFELTAKGADEHYVKDAISAVETKMGLSSGALNYVWFSDDNGNAQVFLLDKGKAVPSHADAPAQPPVEATTKAEACIPETQFVDKDLNHRYLLPPDTVRHDALQIVKQRETKAQCATLGLPLDSSRDEIEAVLKERDAEVARFKPGEDATDDQQMEFSTKSNAILIGLSPYISEDELNKIRDQRDQVASALAYGLNPNASAQDVIDAVKAYGQTIDEDWNVAQRLPYGTSYGQSSQIFSKRNLQSDLTYEGIDINASEHEIDGIRSARSNLLNADQNFDAEGHNMIPDYQISAIQMGLSPDGSQDQLKELQGAQGRRSAAVKLGLPADATQADIDAANALANPKEVKGKVCNVETAAGEAEN